MKIQLFHVVWLLKVFSMTYTNYKKLKTKIHMKTFQLMRRILLGILTKRSIKIQKKNILIKWVMMYKVGKIFNGLIWKTVSTKLQNHFLLIFFIFDCIIAHFHVWMRWSGKSNFRKLWGIIEEDLEAG